MLTRSPAADRLDTGTGLLLSARGLVKSYGRTRVVDGIDLDIPERAFTTLLGPSGCGKTTILRMIAGFETPDSGSIVLDGRSLAGVPPERRPVNTVFQNYALFPHLTVFENVGFALTLRRGDVDPAPRVKRALEAVHMAGFGARYPHQLSGGQQQRVAVARAIVAEPHLLLLDEPLSALDREMRTHLQIELKDLQRRLGIAFVYVTHDQEEAFALSDVIVVMNEGRIVQKADPVDIYARPATAFVAGFIGAATLVPGRIVEIGPQPGEATIETAIGPVTAPATPGLQRDMAAVLAIRPEHLRLVEASSDRPAETFRAETFRAQTFRAEVRHVVYKGDRFLIEAVLNGVTLRVMAERALTPGQAVTLALDGARSFITRA